MRRVAATSAGFTLLEMLVALVVFGLLMAGIAQSMHYGLTAWSAQIRAQTKPQDLVAVDDALRFMIAQAVPDSFTGYPDQMAFTTTLPAGSPLPDRLADVAILPGPGGSFLLRWTPHPPGPLLGPAPAPHTEFLLDGVTAVTVSYLVGAPDGSTAWAASYSNGGLPLLVRLHLVFADGRHWPDLVAAPAAHGS
jgi:general secretion pathway protein J